MYGVVYNFGNQILTFIPNGLNNLLAEGFVVFGWIALWNPVGSFLYDWVPFWRANQVYHYMMTMDIRFQPQPPLDRDTTGEM